MSKSDRSEEQGPEERGPISVSRALGWLLLASIWLVIAVSLFSYDPADPPGHIVAPHHQQPVNWMGWIGAAISHEAYLMLGAGVWILVIGGAVWLATLARRQQVEQPSIRVIGLLMLCIFASAMVSFGMPGFSGIGRGIVGPRPEGAGGLIAIFITDQLLERFNHFGTSLVLGLGFVIGLILAADQIVLSVPRWLGAAVMFISRIPRPIGPKIYPAKEGGFLDRFKPGSKPQASTISLAPGRSKLMPLRGRKRVEEEEDELESASIEAEAKSKSKRTKTGKGRKTKTEPEIEVEDEYEESLEDEYEHEDDLEDYEGSFEDEEVDEDLVELDEEEFEDEQEVVDEDDSGQSSADAPAAYVAEKNGKLSPDALAEKIKKLPIRFAPKQKPAPLPQEMDLTGYTYPPMDLLVDAQGGFSDEQEQQVRDQAMVLESALNEYGIDGEVVAIDSGPAITMFEVRLAPGTKVNRVSAVSSDVARALKAQNIRIVPNMAGKDTIGIEVPNQKKEQVRLKELMSANPGTLKKMRLPMYLGKDASGNPLIADLGLMPHMLIAGTTGSGKSVCMNSIIMSFLFAKRPDELKLVLVDPKMVEMSMFKDIPHLMCPVVTEMSKAAAILEWAVTKMDERYELLAEAGVRDIMGYNNLEREELLLRFNPSNEAEEARIPKKLPYLVFVIDELADLMMTNKEVESDIVRIAQKARAVGIHLILATQRPQANVVTGLIKSNMPCRVSFKVSSGMDSRIVLDQKGAELLLGQGDMLFLSPRTSKLTRSQGTLVDDLEVRKVVKHLKSVAQQHFEPQLVQLKQPGFSNDDENRDPLFEDAVRVVLESQRGSVSLLQRRLTIGYGRASRLIEEIAAAGIIGEHKGSQAREVNLTLEDWEAIKAQAEIESQQPAAVEALANESPAGAAVEAVAPVEMGADAAGDSIGDVAKDKEAEDEPLDDEALESVVEEDVDADEQEEEDAEELDEYEQEEDEYEEEVDEEEVGEEEEDAEDEDDEDEEEVLDEDESDWEDEWEEEPEPAETKVKAKGGAKGKAKGKTKGKSKAKGRGGSRKR